METTHYKAFISYRHAEVDSAVAREVQRGLERFYVPKEVRGDGDKHIAPVFRDKEELPVTTALDEDIMGALANSDALVVICSPRTSESMWVQREIDTFLSSHSKARVFTVLAEGEPADVIPACLLTKEVEVTDENGVTHVERRAIEPLSCDFRNTRGSERKLELTRLAAAILGVRFDALARRTQRRTRRIVAALVSLALVISTGITTFALWSNARIAASYQETLSERSRLLATRAREALDEGDRLKAIELASAALPGAGEDGPVVPEAVKVLSDATYAYGHGDNSIWWDDDVLAAKFNMPNDICGMDVSPNERYLAAADTSNLVKVWDLSSGELLLERQAARSSARVNALLVTNDGLLVLAVDEEVSCYDATTGEQQWVTTLPESYLSFIMNPYTMLWNTEAKVCVIELYKESIVYASYHGICSLTLSDGTFNELVTFDQEGTTGRDQELFWASRTFLDATTGRLVVGRTWTNDTGDDAHGALYLVDLTTHTCTSLEDADARPAATLFLDDGTLAIALQGTALNETVFYANRGYDSTSEYQIPYERRCMLLDFDRNKVLWSHTTPLRGAAYQDAIFAVDAEHADMGGSDVIMHCVANVCECLDRKTGAVLSRTEAAAPFVHAWPIQNASDGSTDLKGILRDGRLAFCGLSSETAMSLRGHVVDAFTSHVPAITLTTGQLLALGTSIYRYEDSFDDKQHVLVKECADDSHIDEIYSTSQGILVLDNDTTSDAPTLTLYDHSDMHVLWEKTFADQTRGYVLNDPTHADRIALAFDNAVTVIDLSDGSTTSHDASVGEYLPEKGSVPLDPYAPTASGTLQAFVDYDLVDDTGVFSLSLTNVLDGSNETFELKRTSLSSFDTYGTHPLVCPRDQHALVVLPNEDDTEGDDGQDMRKFSIVDLHSHQEVELPSPILIDGSADEPHALWTDDGTMLVCACEKGVSVYDVRGVELCAVELDPHAVVGAYVADGRLYVVTRDDGTTVLTAYTVDGGRNLGSLALADHELYAPTWSLVAWSKVSTSPRDPGDLCLYFQSEQTLFLLDSSALAICQTMERCLAYDDVAHAFWCLVRVNDTYRLYTYPRCTVDDLLALGEEQLGASGMSEAERTAYGLGPAR